MLILTRRLSEEFRIGDNIYVKILGVNGTAIKVGIDAPREINIVRTELIERNERRMKCEHKWVSSKLNSKPNKPLYCAICDINYFEYENSLKSKDN